MKFLQTLLVLFFLQCNSREKCPVDTDFAAQFNAQIQQLESEAKRNHLVISGDIIRSLLYLERLTSLKTKAQIGDITHYQSKGDFKKDMQQWEIWYTENKCNVTSDSSNAIMNSVIASTPWMESPK